MKSTIRIAVLSLLLATSILPALAETDEALVMDRWPNALGAGFTSAYNFSGGISYQRWFGPLGLSLPGGVLSNPAEGVQFEYMAYGGLQYRLYAEDFANWLSGGLYLAGNLGVHGRMADSTDWYEPGVNVRYGGGAGIGYELVVARHFSQMAEVLYVAQMRNDAFDQLNIQFTSSLRYRF